MKKIIIFIFFLSTGKSFTNAQPVYISKNSEATFFSETLMENIDARSNSLSSALNTDKNEILFMVPMRSFEFKKALMQEHFNEKYVESDKFPLAIYKGRINDSINWIRDTVCKITSTGLLNIHGVEKQRTDVATLTISKGKINISGSFDVRLADHKIEVPKIVIENIPESVHVKFKVDYQPYMKEEKNKQDKK